MTELRLTPDGARYLSASTQRVSMPFHLRWLLPKVCGKSATRWKVASRAAVVAFALLTAVYAGSPWMACVAFLPGVAFNWRNPVLVDGVGMALALLAAVLLPYSWPAAVAVVLVAGCVRETTGVWASIYAWNPLLLVGLIPVAIRRLMKPGTDVLNAEHQAILEHPFRAGQDYHRDNWTNPFLMVTPWGGLVVGVGSLTWQLAAALTAGYGQLLVATDSVRLYQWAAPVMALSCVHLLPAWSLPLLAVSVIFNPWRGDGA